MKELLAPFIWLKNQGYIFALSIVLLCTLVGLPLRPHIDAVNIGMFYLVAVGAVAARHGLIPSLITSLISVTAFNFFFTEPYFTLNVNDPSYFITFVVMLVVSFFISSMSEKLRRQTAFFRKKNKQITDLYDFTRALASSENRDRIVDAVLEHITKSTSAEVMVIFPDSEELLSDVKEKAIIKYCFEHGQKAGLGTPTMPSSNFLYIPLIANNNVLCVLGVKPTYKHLNAADISLVETYASLFASSLYRLKAEEVAQISKSEAESEKLKNTLLSSISHDFRTPLASITGLASSLLISDIKISKAIKDALSSIRAQAAQLSRIVTNLLEVTNLESSPHLHKEPYFIEEIIGSSILANEEKLNGREIITDIPNDLPLMNIDGILIEQVFTNLIENSVKYTNTNGSIKITAVKNESELLLAVSDNGPGIPMGEETKVFDKFYKLSNDEEGSGLGLAICKAVVGLHGGRIWAENNEGGARISFTLPIDMAQISDDEMKAAS